MTIQKINKDVVLYGIATFILKYICYKVFSIQSDSIGYIIICWNSIPKLILKYIFFIKTNIII